MKQVQIISIGKIKNKSLALEIETLKKRLPSLKITELKEVKESNISILKQKEFTLIKKNITSSNLNILLIEDAKQYTTEEFYNHFFKSNFQKITFIITGPYGPNQDLKNLISNHLSLSKMTFTHEQAQYMLIEQIYRAQCFEKNIPYTK